MQSFARRIQGRARAALAGIRALPWVNRPVRSLLRRVRRRPLPAIGALVRRWRVHGTVSLTLHGVPITLYSAGDDGTVDALYYAPDEYDEYADLAAFLDLAIESTTILDVGAHTGLYSLLASRVQPRATILAFEPYAPNAERLRHNLGLNAVHNVEVLDVALGAADGTTRMAVPDPPRICDVASLDGAFTQRFYRDWIRYVEEEVAVRTLDGIVAERGLARIDLIKVDVENCELEVLEGARDTLTRSLPVVLLESFPDDTRRDFFTRHLAPLGYRVYQTSAAGWAEAAGLMPTPFGRNFFLFPPETGPGRRR